MNVELCQNTNSEKETKSQPELYLKLPIKMSSFGWILNKTEEYIVIFGGYSSEFNEKIKNILILDLTENKFYRSQIQCPRTTWDINAVLIYEEAKSELLIHGFIRNITNEVSIDIPFELLSLFQMFFESERVHLISDEDHYSVELNDIFANKSAELVLDYFTDSDGESGESNF